MIKIFEAMRSLEFYFQKSFINFYAEWKSGKYNKYSDCPSYEEVRVLMDSINILRRHIGWEYITIRDMIELRDN